MSSMNIKVFYKENDGIICRRIIRPQQCSFTPSGQLILPRSHYSKGHIERLIPGINWDCPVYGKK